jgi:RNA polymerase sigma-70 factor (ECF subfamily)
MAAGDRGALQELYQARVRDIHGVVARILGDPEEVREAVQDTFIRAWRQAGEYRAERGEVFGWLVHIARNGSIDRLRRIGRRRSVLVGWAGARDSADGLDAAISDPADDRREWLDHHLGQLSDAQRRALELAFYGGYTQEEIAQRLQTSVGNVKNHLRRGLLKLRQKVLP